MRRSLVSVTRLWTEIAQIIVKTPQKRIEIPIAKSLSRKRMRRSAQTQKVTKKRRRTFFEGLENITQYLLSKHLSDLKQSFYNLLLL